MAKAVKVIKEVPVMTKQVTGVTLTLTMEEAQAIMGVLGNIGGSNNGSYKDTIREYGDVVWNALSIAEVIPKWKGKRSFTIDDFYQV